VTVHRRGGDAAPAVLSQSRHLSCQRADRHHFCHFLPGILPGAVKRNSAPARPATAHSVVIPMNYRTLPSVC